MLAADVSNWLRPDAATSPGRLFCHVYGRGKGQAQMIPGWPYSVIAALEPGRTSWTAVLDAVRLGPDDDATAVTAAQAREVITRLVTAGHPPLLVIFDAGYDLPRLACLLAGLPAQVLGRLRSDRVMQLPAPSRLPHTRGRPRKHGGQLALANPATWPAPQVTTSTATSRYGRAGHHRPHRRLAPRCTAVAASPADPGAQPVPSATSNSCSSGASNPSMNPRAARRGSTRPNRPAIKNISSLNNTRHWAGSTLWLAATASSSGVHTTPHDHPVAVLMSGLWRRSLSALEY